MPASLSKKNIVKKRRAAFLRPHADRWERLGKTGWRRPKGIDSRVRRRWNGQRPMVKVGYGSNKATRHQRPNKFYTFLVHNVADVDLLLVNNRTYAAEIGHAVSFKTRKEILSRAQQLDVKVTNPNARVRKQE
jgi:large subunit ribosomal protein L32e